MTNLEYYKDEIKVAFVHDEYLCDPIRRVASRYGYDTKGFVSEGKVIDWLLEEHKEKFKLKQWEYDLLEFCGDETRFESWRTLMCLKEKGHFKGIENTGMRISYILKNCEVVD